MKDFLTDPILLKIVLNTTGILRVEIPGFGIHQTYPLTPNVTEISLPDSLRSEPVGVSNHGIMLSSNVEISVCVRRHYN